MKYHANTFAPTCFDLDFASLFGMGGPPDPELADPEVTPFSLRFANSKASYDPA